jgi:putative lipoic acid-binding regulatory protein
LSDSDQDLGESTRAASQGASVEDPEVARQRAIALLEANHVFPTEYAVSVIAVNTDGVTQEIVAAVCAELEGPLPGEAHEVRPSAQGKYVSHRLAVPCANAEHVLRLYARLRAVEGVKTIL